ncbi:DnaJ domain-containing protein [Niveibacterium sp. 24ML]|uniref:DnaJ domain-containing protein n=1 Tax=Niveibacterium sp. 24ML TaxID=2985512 RepID=UPI00226F5EEF|nr:DnaJ domain-containing protein [Niveibacterium sp. 24ML]MCX9155820.1 DnaJ domain-containing protein [Niveibacterium sp. 24ML]
MKKTLYNVLGVSESAGPVAIRAAYDRIVEECAPERARPENAEDLAIRLVAAREAWYVLSDENRRAVYDASLKTAPPPLTEMARPAAARAPINPDDVIAAYAGTARASQNPNRGRWWIWALVLLLILPAGWWFRLGTVVGSPDDQAARQREAVERMEREQSDGPARSPADLERERLEREAREAEWQARRDRDAAERAERERQRELEQARREADYISRNLEYSQSRTQEEERRAAEKARRDAERASQEDRRERERLAAAAKRQLEREKAYLQQLEQDNRAYRPTN